MNVRYFVSRGKGYIYVKAIVNSRRVGKVGFMPMDYGHELEDEMVYPKYKHKGIGITMLKIGLSYCNVVRLCCFSGLIPFYEKVGFKVIEGICPEQDMVRMEWRR